MNILKQFIIPFEGLELGNHPFQFEIDYRFFEELEYTEINNGKFSIKLALEKTSTMLILNFDISGSLVLKCDRCMGDLNHKLKFKEKLICKLNNEGGEDSDEVINLPNNKNEIDISQYIYEYIILSISSRVVHKEKDCNPEVLKLLKITKKQNTDIDPRWDALKNLN